MRAAARSNSRGGSKRAAIESSENFAIVLVATQSITREDNEIYFNEI